MEKWKINKNKNKNRKENENKSSPPLLSLTKMVREHTRAVLGLESYKDYKRT